jgi:hypothetical protein
MRQYNKYLVKNTDQFDAASFPFIDDEIANVNRQINHLPSSFRNEIMISFLKDHFLQNTWTEANPVLAKLVTSGSLFSGDIESLFDSSRENPVFTQHLERYLVARFSAPDSLAENVSA